MTPGAKLARCIIVASIVLFALPGGAQIVTDPPEAHSPVTLLAVSGRESGRVAFAFAGKEQAPVMRAMPGELIRITYRMERSGHRSQSPPANCSSGVS
jgi:hypothetical protein